jgi:hypothetical protein
MVRAPAALLVEKEEMLRRKAMRPFPARVRSIVREGRSGVREEERVVVVVLVKVREESSPVRWAYIRDWINARGDMRRRTSRGERAKSPVITLFVATV